MAFNSDFWSSILNPPAPSNKPVDLSKIPDSNSKPYQKPDGSWAMRWGMTGKEIPLPKGPNASAFDNGMISQAPSTNVGGPPLPMVGSGTPSPGFPTMLGSPNTSGGINFPGLGQATQLPNNQVGWAPDPSAMHTMPMPPMGSSVGASTLPNLDQGPGDMAGKLGQAPRMAISVGEIGGGTSDQATDPLTLTIMNSLKQSKVGAPGAAPTPQPQAQTPDPNNTPLQ